MGLNNHALFQVATKALVRKDDTILVLLTPDGYIDFPGGRVDESETELSWPQALQREISEEIGSDIQIAIGQTLFVSKRQYTSHAITNRIAAIFFACEYQGGEVVLSDEHGDYLWMTPADLLASDKPFVSADEKTQLQAYFTTRS